MSAIETRWSAAVVAALLAGWCAGGASAQWVVFDEAPERLSAPLPIGADDVEEKDFARGDVDHDGDVDLVVVRKQPFTTTGRRQNVLLMNEDGVLTDRTAQYASASDVAGDLGFLTPTNDRDVALTDVNLDGWLDIVTAPTLSDGQPKHVSHPRVYVNLGEIDGIWQGFEHQDARIPELHPVAAPRFCAVAAGDVTGDGAPDLFFSDYDSGGTQIFDFNDRLLVNDGTGHFVDETFARLTEPMYVSGFGIAAEIRDMNQDGALDIVRLAALTAPTHVGIAFNPPGDPGHFTQYEMVYQLSPYHMATGDLNGDGNLDIVVGDDGVDRYLLNEGNDGSGGVDFTMGVFGPESSGFPGNIVVADLDGDGRNEVIVADVDVDIPGCSNRTVIFRNQALGGDVDFEEQGEVIPFTQLTGVHDVAAIDLDGDDRLDLVLGRCTGTDIWMNTGPTGLGFSYPDGLPGFLTPGEPTTIRVKVIGGGTSEPAPGTGTVSYATGPEGSFTTVPMTALGANVYAAELPPLDCGEHVRFTFGAESLAGEAFTDPPNAPASAFFADAATGLETSMADDVEQGGGGWTVESDPSLASGAWAAVEPIGTVTTSGVAAAPAEDATPGAGTLAFVTENGAPGGAAADSDVDGGPTRLVSPSFSVVGSDAIVSYARWFTSVFGATDRLEVEISADDGATWTPVPEHTTSGTAGAWQIVSFRVADHVTPSAEMRVRFTTADPENDSITEAGIDEFRVDRFVCPPVDCPADANDDGAVGVDDLLAVLLAWGPCPAPCGEDVTSDAVVDVDDVVAVILSWGCAEGGG